MAPTRPMTPDYVLFESPIAPKALRALISLATGAAFVLASTFLEWGLNHNRRIHSALFAGALVGVAVSLVMLWTTFTSKTVRRVVLSHSPRSLCLHRDSGQCIEIPLASVRSADSQPAPGGYSRDPAERLVITLRDGSSQTHELPDEADTPALAAELRALLANTL